MLDLDTDLVWSDERASDRAQGQSAARSEPNLDAYLDFLEDIEAFRSARGETHILLYDEVFEL